MKREDFGQNFEWGVATAAHQIEGAWATDGKGPSIWDTFSHTKGKIFEGQNADVSCDFYHRYEQDLDLMQALNIPGFRFSLAWSRIFPQGTGKPNPKGVDFYHRLIDACLARKITPWVTLYHWDLPQALQDKGGWTNRQVLDWFTEFASFCAKTYGDKVKNWMVLNEPMVFTGAGHFLGVHAPGLKGTKNFLKAVHHATLCQAEGGRVLRQFVPDAKIGTTFSCSYIAPASQKPRDVAAAQRVDALLNRLFLEPALGLGYPLSQLKAFSKIEKYFLPGDEQAMIFGFDFIGIQNYTREVVAHSWLTPYIQAKLIKAEKRAVPITLMNWEVYPQGIYELLKKYGSYPNIPKILVTENGAAFTDELADGQVKDQRRVEFLRDYIGQVGRALAEGVPVEGYFIWTFTDNFEWAEGYYPRFGIVHIDFETQVRTVKDSGKWYQSFLENGQQV